MSVLLFHRGSGVGYIVEAEHVDEVRTALARVYPEGWVRAFEVLQVPIGGAIRIRAIGEGHLDVTTAARRDVL